MPSPEVLSRPFSSLEVGLRETVKCHLEPHDIDRFSAISGDHSPLHLDASFARARGFEGRVAHGALLAALVSQLVGNRLPGALGVLQSMDLEFRRPVIPPIDLLLMGEILSLSVGTRQVSMLVKVSSLQGELFAQARVRSIVRD
jgi:3-hydroxybutyryl-CoA dehydratase